jgi:hypothetical protein
MIVLSIGGAIYVSALALVSIVAGFAGTPRFQHHPPIQRRPLGAK